MTNANSIDEQPGSAVATGTPATRAMRTLGPIILAEWRARVAPRHLAAVPAGSPHAVALCLAVDRPLAWRRGTRQIACPPDGALLLDLADKGEITGDGRHGALLVLLPRRMATTLAAGRLASRSIARSSALEGLRRLATGLLRQDVRLGQAQDELAARAFGELLTVALLPLSPQSPGAATRRAASLLDRVIAHVDRHLADELDAASICRAVSCSRSALYRATSPLNGVGALVMQRRLAAAHDRLCDPDDARSIAAIARAHGFADPARFSRSFRKSYGQTAADLRRHSRDAGHHRPRVSHEDA